MNENINNTQIYIKYEDLVDEIENPLLKSLCNSIASTKKGHIYLAESGLYSDFAYRSDMAKILVNMMDNIQFTLLRMDFSAITFFYNYEIRNKIISKNIRRLDLFVGKYRDLDEPIMNEKYSNEERLNTAINAIPNFNDMVGIPDKNTRITYMNAISTYCICAQLLEDLNEMVRWNMVTLVSFIIVNETDAIENIAKKITIEVTETSKPVICMTSLLCKNLIADKNMRRVVIDEDWNERGLNLKNHLLPLTNPNSRPIFITAASDSMLSNMLHNDNKTEGDINEFKSGDKTNNL